MAIRSGQVASLKADVTKIKRKMPEQKKDASLKAGAT
jgi:hypothetical protein